MKRMTTKRMPVERMMTVVVDTTNLADAWDRPWMKEDVELKDVVERADVGDWVWNIVEW